MACERPKHGAGTGRRRRRGERGFTLLELLVVLAILGLLAGLVAPRVIDYFSRAKSETARLQIESMTTALDLFRLDVGRYPTQSEGLEALVARPASLAAWRGPYLKGNSVPLDPWSRPYQFRIPGQQGRAFDLFSLGADGAPGGEGENRDVYNR